VKRQAGLRLQSLSDVRHIHSGRYSHAIRRVRVVLSVPDIHHTANPSCHRFGAAPVTFSRSCRFRDTSRLPHVCTRFLPHSFPGSCRSHTWADTRLSPILFDPVACSRRSFPRLISSSCCRFQPLDIPRLPMGPPRLPLAHLLDLSLVILICNRISDFLL